MEIKRRITAIAKAMSPQIEVGTSAKKITQLCDQLEYLVNYEQEKIDRSAARKAAGQDTIGKQVDDRKKAEQKKVADNQNAEADQNADDQAEAHEARNKAHRERTGSTALDDAGKKPPQAKKKASKKKK